MKQKPIFKSCVEETIPRRPPVNRFVSELSPGTVIQQRYELVEPLGHGGMSEVYGAVDLVTRTPVAIKLLSRSFDDDGVAVERFTREARTTVKLNHPNIVRLLDAGVDDTGQRFMVMERLKGETLADWLRHIPLAGRREAFIRELLLILLDVCRGVSAAHGEGVLHRDLKPSNVFLHRDANDDVIPKVLDFGIAKDLGLGEPKLTTTGQITGSIDYVSPEQMEERDADFRADVYALGVILYEGLSGATPFGDTSRAMVIVRAVDDRFRIIPPSRHNSQVPRYLDRIVFKALKRRPDERYGSVAELAEVLAPLPILHPVQATGSHGMTAPPARGAGVIGTVLLGLAVAAIIAAGVIIWRAVEADAPRDNDHRLSSVGPEPRTGAEPATAPRAPAAPSGMPTPAPLAETETGRGASSSAPSTQMRAASPRPHRRTVQAPSPKRPPTSSPREATGNAADVDVKALVAEGYDELADLNFKTAEARFNDAVRHSPGHARAWFGLAKVAFETKAFAASLERVNRALAIRDSARWRIFRGEIRLAKGDRDGAAAEWRQIMRDFPDDDVAQKVAGRHLEKIGIRSVE